MMKNIWEKWAVNAFGAAAAPHLAMLRMAAGGFAFWYVCTRYDMLLRIARSGTQHFQPVGLARLLEAPLAPATFEVLLLATLLLNALFLLGWQYKWVGPAFSLMLLFVLCYRNSWSMIYHSSNALVLQVLVLGWAPAADALSLDALFARTGPPRRLRWVLYYGWPILLLCIITALTYFVAGVAKVSSELSWGWVSGEAMRGQVAADALRKAMYGYGISPLFAWLYPHKWAFMLMAFTALVLELGAPLFLLEKRLRLGWALGTWLMHWGIYFIMGITFRYQLSGLIFLPFWILPLWQLLSGGWKYASPSQTEPPEQIAD